MHLKSIQLKGFKSFPDRLGLEFGPGVSVIVGPNGSGKSNVTDAVLWALGEQSPVAVRGQSMQDVIFAGGHGRQAAGAAEVEVVLDNSDGALPIDFTEISIMRRLDRSGEGEYRLNGARCRLVDVIEVLSDSGLGKEMHSIISQGRVEALVTSKPRDRRLLIEEAAGLGKHRKRRRRAQLKLARTQDNLDRALDVEREARSRLRPLKRQAEAAELHERLERQTTEARWTLARDAVRERRAELTVAEAAVAQARADRAGAESRLADVARRREEAEHALAAHSQAREQLAQRAYAARGAAERIELRLDRARETQDALAARIAHRETELDALAAQLAEEGPDLEGAGRLAGLEAELAELEAKRQGELESELVQLAAQRDEAAAEAQRLGAEAEVARTALGAAEARVEAARAARREAEQAVEAARRDAARAGGELAAANQFLRTHAGSAPGGRSALADELEVAPGLELALTAALGGRLGAAIVDSIPDGAALLEAAGDQGGSALVSGAPAADAGSPPVPGAERLVDHLRGPEPARALASTLLADAWVVDDVTDVPDGFTGIAVTRGGRAWFGAHRELRQAPRGGEETVLAMRNRRDELISQSEAAAAAEQRAQASLGGAAETLAAADREREAADAAARAALRARDGALEESRRIDWVIEQRRKAPDEGAGALRRAQIAAELAAERRLAERVERERAEREARLEAGRARLAAERALLPAAQSLRDALERVLAVVSERATALDGVLAQDRSAGERIAGQLRACAQEEAGIQRELHERSEAVTGCEVRAQRARDGAAESEHELAGLAERLGLAADPAEEALDPQEREALAVRVERLLRRREQLGPVNPLAKAEYDEAVEHVEALEAQRTDLESALRELNQLIRDTDRTIRESFEQTFEAAAKNFEDVAGRLFPGGRGRLTLVKEETGPRAVLGGQQAPDDEAGPAAQAADDEATEAAAEAEENEEEDLLGVEIEITPAGKAMKRLSLLSGGEKSLTALAFLFAVFLARPCPFYILDEVEAALDDANIERFITLLREYSQRAQFIVVTHQKRTMEAADTLYGVSMGGDGISKVVSRRLPSQARLDEAAA